MSIPQTAKTHIRHKPFVVKVWNFVKDVIIDVVTGIRKFWETNGEKIWNTVKTIFTNIWMCVKSAFSIIGDALNKFSRTCHIAEPCNGGNGDKS